MSSPKTLLDSSSNASSSGLPRSSQHGKASSTIPVERVVAPASFVHSDIALQRSSSKVLEQTEALGRVLSNRVSRKLHISEHKSSMVSDEDGYLQSSIPDNGIHCSLGKSLSERSTKSVQSLHATGTFPIGSLHIHSPSPQRSSNSETPEFLTLGDIIVTREIGPGTLFGCDSTKFTVPDGKLFEGLKNVPIGVHLIWSSANEDSFRQGFWIISSNRAQSEYGEVIVKRWDKYSKVLDEEVSAAEIMIQQRSTPEFVQDLAAYDKVSLYTKKKITEKRPNIWAELTSSIRGSLLTKITGCGWNRWVVSSNQERKPSSHQKFYKHSTSYAKDEVLRFTFSHHYRSYHRHVAAQEKTAPFADTSGHIQAITNAKCDDNDADEIIGELQFCYLTGICLKNQTCMEHWAHIVKMVFQAFLMAINQPIFFANFIKAVHAQLIFDERGEGESIFDHDMNFKKDLKNILTIFKSQLIAMLLKTGSSLTADQNSVGKAFEDLESWLCRWNWDLRGNTGIEPKEPEENHFQ
ncbi:hypothetical protein K3495_g10550 [Podosphaera aphanis]|nr:hypothetical protein K3495_g10550 [Podosphaera aphanis]